MGKSAFIHLSGNLRTFHSVPEARCRKRFVTFVLGNSLSGAGQQANTHTFGNLVLLYMTLNCLHTPVGSSIPANSLPTQLNPVLLEWME